MPPRHRFTEEEIIEGAFRIVRRSGIDSLTARSLAAELRSSPKVIFGYFSGMDEVKAGVMARTRDLYSSLMMKALSRTDVLPYRSCGMCYVEFAHDEKELFRLLFMRDEAAEPMFEDPTLEAIYASIAKGVGVSIGEARELHRRYSIFAYGLACSVLRLSAPLDREGTDRLLSETWEDLARRYRREK